MLSETRQVFIAIERGSSQNGIRTTHGLQCMCGQPVSKKIWQKPTIRIEIKDTSLQALALLPKEYAGNHQDSKYRGNGVPMVRCKLIGKQREVTPLIATPKTGHWHIALTIGKHLDYTPTIRADLPIPALLIAAWTAVANNLGPVDLTSLKGCRIFPDRRKTIDETYLNGSRSYWLWVCLSAKTLGIPVALLVRIVRWFFHPHYSDRSLNASLFYLLFLVRFLTEELGS